MFTGEYYHTLDSKGRVIIPSRLREGLGERFMLARGLDQCIFVYPMSGFATLHQDLKRHAITNNDTRVVSRVLFAGAMEVEADKQGRVLIPQNLREHANIEKDLVIIGVSDRVEIWNDTAWRNYLSGAKSKYEIFAENMDSTKL
ncbi:MAG TPA: division/cell wall cluster transcriptional repressor MraZ [Candidatus Limnocylindrales bacterium]|nr:division/cell wall cluster transcriptional repressor MraZ [Candidatus Limnocylindrales bacterium]